MAFPSFVKAQNYKGGYEKWVYDQLKKLSKGEYGPDSYDVSVSVTDGSNALGSVAVTLTGSKVYKGKTGSRGNCNLNDVLAGTYTVNAVKEGYTFTETEVEVTENQELDLVMVVEEDDEDDESTD